jgi:two-component system, cell cycle response regulator CpdR
VPPKDSVAIPMALILLADDDANMRDLVRRSLEGDGHTVAVAQDGTDAYDQLVAAKGVDLLISDIDMPGLTGIELARRAIAQAPKLKIILISGHASGFSGTDALKPNLREMLTKPLSLDTLRTKVRAVVAT